MADYRYEYITKWLDAGLLDTSKMVFWHNVVPGETGPAVLYDYSGNNLNVLTANDTIDNPKMPPQVLANVVGGKPGLFFNGANTPLVSGNSAFNFKHLFVLAKIAGASFAGLNGLISDRTNIALLVGGGANTNVFYNNNYAANGYKYYKNAVEFSETNQAAPFGGFGLIEIVFPEGVELSGIQYGRDRLFSGRLFNGWLIDSIALKTEQKDVGRAKIFEYFRQKYNLSFLPIVFPTKEITGIRATVAYDAPPAYKEITVTHEYADKSRYSVEIAPTANAPRRWKITFPYVRENKRYIFDEFFDAARFVRKFELHDKYGRIWEDVEIEDYSRAVRGARTWQHPIEFDLVSFSGKWRFAVPEIPIIPPVLKPAPPTGFSVVKTSDASVTASWNAAIAGTYPVAGYTLWRNGSVIPVPNQLSFSVGSLPYGTHDFKVAANDTFGNQSAWSETVNIILTRTPTYKYLVAPDNRKLITPTGLRLIDG